MVERVYLALWGIYFVALAIFFAGGLMTTGLILAFGFVFFSMVFLGMIGVLPHYSTHRKTPLEL